VTIIVSGSGNNPTVRTIVKRAIRLLTTDRTPDNDELADGLEALNARIDTLRLEKLFCFSMQSESLPLVATQFSYQIGPSGDLDTVRPVAIEDAWIESSDGTTYGVSIITNDQYDAIPDKGSTSNWPRKITYRNTLPTGTLLVWRVPSQASTLKLLTRVVLTGFSTVDDPAQLAPGYEELLVSELAIVLAPEYETEPPQSVLQMSRSAKQAIRTNNSEQMIGFTELPYLVGRRPRTNILTDQ
jgi:hypothetical protein